VNNIRNKKISVVIPIFNEGGNILELIKRLNLALLKTKKPFELIFVDDNSKDNTDRIFKEFKNNPKIITVKKDGKMGKAFSLIQGFEKATGEVIAMIDGDLQYPPEALPEMIKALGTADVIVANRKKYKDKTVRKLLSNTFRFVSGRMLFGLRHDIQSGLKVFTKEAFDTVRFTPSSAWTFDLEFLHRARQAGFKIQNFDIVFSKRKNGHSKVAFIKTTFEIGFNALCLRAKRIHPVHILPKQEGTMLGAGIGFGKKKYITHTTIHHDLSALRTFTSSQKLIIALIFTGVGFLFYYSPLLALQVLVGILSTIYFADVLFNLYLIGKSLSFPQEISSTEKDLNALKDEKLPTYTILCPLYREAQVIPQFLEAIGKLSWPKDKLDVLLLLEEDDKVTIDAVSKMNLPQYVRTLIVPHSIPKTKPKACNYGLAHAKGEYLVIYDAEDIPDTMQLKKAYLGFSKVKEDVICLQAKLNYYNPHQNLLTRFFTAEYSLWFDVTLTGLQSMDTAIPLGGTSNHFRIGNLRQVEGWDPFNVTEDADLGIRLFKKGYKTAMIDSTTLEEANSKVGNWFRQRSRWIKGYMQTYLVHTRHSTLSAKGKRKHSLIFQLVIGGKIAFVLINPFLWVATFSYFALYAYVGPAIEALYPSIVFYMAVTSLVFGNFLFLYYYMIGLAKKGQWNLIKFVFLIPLYWLMISISAFIALYQLIFKPHYWEKTVHGFHLNKAVKERKIQAEIRRPAYLPAVNEETKRRRFGFNVARWGYVDGVFLIGATVFANFFNFVYNAYLGRQISIEDFGLVSLVGSLYYLSTIPVGAISKTVTHRTAFLLGKHEMPLKQFWSHIRFRAIIAGAFATAIWLALIPALSTVFKSPSWEPFILFAPVWFIGITAAVDSGFLSGNLKFKVLALLIFIDSIAKFTVAFIFVESGNSHFVYAATPIAMAMAFLVGWLFVARIRQPRKIINQKVLNFPKKFFITSAFAKFSTIAFLSFDLILAKLFLPPGEAGLYALISLIGKMVFFSGSLFSQFINPLTSREEGAQRKSNRVFYKLFFASILVSFAAYLAVGLFGAYTVPLLLGEKVGPILYLLPIYGLAMFCFSIANSLVTYHQIQRKYLLSIVSFLLAFAQILAIYFYHATLEEIVIVMAFTGIASFLITVLLYLIYEPVLILGRNLIDLAGVLTFSSPKVAIRPESLRILILNWRDTRHKWAGGAEIYINEIAKRWRKEGNQVTLFCGNDSHSPRNEVIDGINVVRRGGLYTVYLWGFLYYILKFRGKYDVIIDSENGLPFFTPLYVKEQVLLIVYHIHQEVFREHLRFPLSGIVRFLEGSLMPKVYRNNRVITISKSSKDDILNLGLGKKNGVSIVHPGIESALFKKQEKTKNPLFTYVGRLKPYKNVDIAIEAFAEVAGLYPNAQFLVIGEGESLTSLEKLTRELNIENNVTFTGRVSEAQKARLLAKSWVVLQPSMIEGWGITVIEANAAGTPVIASDVNGLRDSVVHGQTGTLVPIKDVDAFAQAMIDLILDKKYREVISDNAYSWSKNFSWDDSSKQFFLIVANSLRYSKIRSGRIQLAVSKLISIFL